MYENCRVGCLCGRSAIQRNAHADGMTTLAAKQNKLAATKLIRAALHKPGTVDDQLFQHARHNRAEVEHLHVAQLGTFVAYLKNTPANQLTPEELHEIPTAAARAQLEYRLDTHAEWVLLVILRRLACDWNPWVRLYHGLADEPDDARRFPEEWAAVRGDSRIQPSTFLLDVCRRAVALDNFTCPPVRLMHALEVHNLATYKADWLRFHARRLPPTGLGTIVRRINDMCEQMRIIDPGVSFMQKRQWLMVRLASPLGATTLEEYMAGEQSRGAIGTVGDAQKIADGKIKGWDGTGYSGMYKVVRNTVSLLRWMISEPVEEIVDDDAKMAEGKSQAHVPKVPNLSDMMSELTAWLQNAPGRHAFKLPACFGLHADVQAIVPWLQEILTFVLFAHKIDQDHNLNVADAFMNNYTLLESNLGRHRERWQTLTIKSGLLSYPRCPMIYIGREGFCVIDGRHRTEFTSRAADACAAWYKLCRTSCKGRLNTGQHLDKWAEKPFEDDDEAGQEVAQGGSSGGQ